MASNNAYFKKDNFNLAYVTKAAKSKQMPQKGKRKSPKIAKIPKITQGQGSEFCPFCLNADKLHSNTKTLGDQICIKVTCSINILIT